MSESVTQLEETEASPQARVEDILYRIKADTERLHQVRKGVCLINAGKYEEAEAAYARILDDGQRDPSADKPTASVGKPTVSAGKLTMSVSSGLAASLIGRGDPEAAADQFGRIVADDPGQITARIRHALSLWASKKCNQAVASLREGIRENPECAELHFQLGTLLAAKEEYEEAELRFTQALNIDPDHTESLVSYSLCCAVRNAPSEALSYLRRAQARRPGDARVGLLLSHTAKAVRQQGLSVRVRARMPEEHEPDDAREIAELVRIVEAEPEFADAFLALPAERVDNRVFTLLLRSLQTVISRHPENSELHHQYARVLDRLGRHDDAIKEHERAVRIDPNFVRALIELAKLYHKTDHAADAKTRIERAIKAGAEYADVYYLLGNIYRDEGRVIRARSAYRHALLLNKRYEAASQALEALPV